MVCRAIGIYSRCKTLYIAWCVSLNHLMLMACHNSALYAGTIHTQPNGITIPPETIVYTVFH